MDLVRVGSRFAKQLPVHTPHLLNQFVKGAKKILLFGVFQPIAADPALDRLGTDQDLDFRQLDWRVILDDVVVVIQHHGARSIAIVVLQDSIHCGRLQHDTIRVPVMEWATELGPPLTR